MERYNYTCPACEEEFTSVTKNGFEECPNCEEELELVNGKGAYFLDEIYDADNDTDDEDEDDDDEDEE